MITLDHLSIQKANASKQATPLELGIVKSFEFVSQLRRASVIVKKFKATGADIYVKGAPECMREICKPESCMLPSVVLFRTHSYLTSYTNYLNSVPVDYDELLASYTHRGFRVIGIATKHVTKLSWLKAQKMKRTDAESELMFAGFIIFENKLKSQTTAAINELEEAAIRKVMCTGDNILTAISVARECNLISKTAHVFVPHFIEGMLFISTLCE